VGRDFHGGSTTSNRTDSALLHLTDFKGAKSGKHYFIPGSKGLLNAFQNGSQCGIGSGLGTA
jgi:hypothetical protein